MPRQLEKLRATVNDLELELNGLGELDDDSRALLEEAAREIQDALRKNDKQAISPEPLANRLRGAASTFESSHPTLAGLVQKVIDALGQLGI
jgi:hypothetical protein